MKTSTTAIIASILAVTGVYAAPVADSTKTLAARSNYVRLCRNGYFGDCHDYWKSTGLCVDMTSSMNDEVSSLDTYGATCTFFMDGGCNGAPYRVTGSFPSIPGNYNDKISSFRCDN